VAIKVAPFNRYDTLDVVRAVADAGRAGEIALYTGNDDSIVVDLLTEHVLPGVSAGPPRRVRMVGGLLGHWAFWTRQAVALHQAIRGRRAPRNILGLGARITDANGAVFDAANGFAGCIPGIHEVLRRQGLLLGRWCLDPREELSPGQMAEIDRVWRMYPELRDDGFVARGLERWLR
jgi:hypothetical protein